MKDPYQSMVREFHERFGLPVRDTPSVGTPEERVLRVRLMLEEVLEFAEAAGVMVCMEARRVEMRRLWIGDSAETPDLTAMAHELADVAYVTHGTADTFGIPLLACAVEVHGANLRKAGPDGKPVVDERGKLRKPEGWRPADVGAVLKRLNGATPDCGSESVGIDTYAQIVLLSLALRGVALRPDSRDGHLCWCECARSASAQCHEQKCREARRSLGIPEGP